MLWISVWVLFLLWGSCWGRFVVEKNSLKVTSPESLKGIYECAIGNFGVPQYGGTMVGIVAYPKDNQKACKGFRDFDISFKSKPGGFPTFLLVDRGGAAAILVADNKVEPLITMDTPEEEDTKADYLQDITIPSALISKSFGDSLKKAIENGDMVSVNLDWRESLPHPDDRVEYEFWTNSNDECGPKCDSQVQFVKNFKGAAQIMEKKGYTQFTPHYITWYCPEAFLLSKQCKSQCINRGRYCAPDPEQDFSKGYDGKDVVIQNLRQVCLFQVANESGKPWLWWDYVTDFAIRCPMKEKKYTKECAEEVIKSLDEENPVLKAEQDAQDTFRGRLCECPVVKGVKLVGDGYTHCEGKTASTEVGWSFLWVILFGLVIAGVGGPLCICIDVNILSEWLFCHDTSALASTQLPSDGRMLGIYINGNADAELHCSAIALVALLSLANYVNIDADAEQRRLAVFSSEEIEVGEAEDEGEGELNHHVIGTIGGSVGENKVGGGGDKNTMEKDGLGDHCMSSVVLVDAHPPEVGPKAPELVTSTGEAVCIRHSTRQQRLVATAGGRFHDDSSFRH
ncbi:hypothetical protein GW17_00033236 [Ensete ventricosum]|nr:hypothetical protein GW17_00033236 [Ensete ventricosum]